MENKKIILSALVIMVMMIITVIIINPPTGRDYMSYPGEINNSTSLLKSKIFEIQKFSFSEEPQYQKETELIYTLKLFPHSGPDEINETVKFVSNPNVELIGDVTHNVMLSDNPVEIRQKVKFIGLGASAIGVSISGVYEEFDRLYLVVSENEVEYGDFPFAEHKSAPLKKISPIFYLIVLIPILIIGLIIFLAKKLNYSLKQVLKSIGISLLITIFLQIALLFASRFMSQPICATGAHCPSQAEILMESSRYILPIIFLIVLTLYYIISFFKKRLNL